MSLGDFPTEMGDCIKDAFVSYVIHGDLQSGRPVVLCPSAIASTHHRLDFLIGAEDKRMLETFDTVLPMDQTSLVSVQADKCSVEWRRQFAALLAK